MASTCLKYDVCLVVAHFAAECAHPVFFIHENNEEGCTLEVYNKIIELKKNLMKFLFILFAANFTGRKTSLKVNFFQLIRIVIYDEQQ